MRPLLSTCVAFLATCVAAMPCSAPARADESGGLPSLAEIRAAVEAREAHCRPLALRFSTRSTTADRPTPGRDVHDATLVASLDGAIPTVLRFTGQDPPGSPEDLYDPPNGPHRVHIEIVFDRRLTILKRPASSPDVPWRGAQSAGRQLFTVSPIAAGLSMFAVVGQPLSAYLAESRANVVGLEEIEPFGPCVVVDLDWGPLDVEEVPAPGSEHARPGRLWISMDHGAYPVRGRLHTWSTSDLFEPEPTLDVSGRAYRLMQAWDVVALSSGHGPVVPLAARMYTPYARGASSIEFTVAPDSIATGEAALRIAEELLHDATSAEVRYIKAGRAFSWSPPPLPAPESLPAPPAAAPAPEPTEPRSQLVVSRIPRIPVGFLIAAVVLAVLLVLAAARPLRR